MYSILYLQYILIFLLHVISLKQVNKILWLTWNGSSVKYNETHTKTGKMRMLQKQIVIVEYLLPLWIQCKNISYLISFMSKKILL